MSEKCIRKELFIDDQYCRSTIKIGSGIFIEKVYCNLNGAVYVIRIPEWNWGIRLTESATRSAIVALEMLLSHRVEGCEESNVVDMGDYLRKKA